MLSNLVIYYSKYPFGVSTGMSTENILGDELHSGAFAKEWTLETVALQTGVLSRREIVLTELSTGQSG